MGHDKVLGFMLSIVLVVGLWPRHLPDVWRAPE